MTSIRNDGQEVRHGGRSNRSENLKEAEAPTAAPAATETPGPVAKDQVNLREARRDEGPSRELPNLMAWGEGVAESALDLAGRAVEGGKKLWDGAAEALGFGDEKGKPAATDGPKPAQPDTAAEGGQAERAGEAGGGAPASETAGAGAAAGQSGEAGNPPGSAPPNGDVSQAGAAQGADQPQAGGKPKGPQLQGIPPRPEDARGGKEFIESIKHLKPGPERDKAILDEIMKGNIPDNLRDLKEVNVQRKGKDGQSHDLTMHVMPDYLSIGSNEDNVRIPMTPAVAQAIADKTGTSLPTDRMVDDIHTNADKKLNMDPFQWKPGNEHARNMQSVDWYQQHDQRIDNQLGTGEAQSGIVSGHKKDLVIPNKDGRVAIYGGTWPGTDKRVQPYSNLHENTYEDYSHGARLVSQDVVIDGRTMKLSEVLADPNLAPLVTRFPPGANGEPAGLHNRYNVPERLQQ